MSELTDLVSKLEKKYGSSIPHNDPDFILLQEKYWGNNRKKASKKTSKIGYKSGSSCKVIDLQTGKEHIFKSFAQASRFYGYSNNWALNQYNAQKRGVKSKKYKIVKLGKRKQVQRNE